MLASDIRSQLINWFRLLQMLTLLSKDKIIRKFEKEEEAHCLDRTRTTITLPKKGKQSHSIQKAQGSKGEGEGAPLKMFEFLQG